MPPAVNIVGHKYGRWTVVSRSTQKYKESLWNCVCECGSTAVITASNLRGGKSKSCGCYKSEAISEARTTHGQSKSPIYIVWMNMKARCCNPNHEKYPDYGGRGITVCTRWLDSFEDFSSDMGEMPSPKHSIDRIDVNGHYEPGNCRWATGFEQAHNRRDNRMYTYNGETKTMTEWAREYGLNPGTLSHRLLKLNLPIEKALTMAKRKGT